MTSVQDLIFAPLNTEQRSAVEHTKGPVLILAGAGSGKTRALTHRIAHLIDQGVKPWQILAVTFTNKAAKEMKSRLTGLLSITEGETIENWESKKGRLPITGTFHSICVRILRRDIEHLGRDRTFTIYDTDDQERLMKEILKEMHIDSSELKPRAVLSHIGRFKCEVIGPADAKTQATSDRMERIVQAYGRYEKSLREANALDFDDLILETVRLFHECPDVLDRYQETWQYLHVDEYQDTNHAQYLFITLLAKKYRNLCVIGDPDQSIYSFRGADIRNILEFERDYTDAKNIKLEQNYRSAQPILTAADTVIAANPNRPEKNMWTDRKEGPQIIVHELADEKSESREAVATAVRLRSQGIALRDQAILYRTNAQSRLFEEACLREGIPYRIIGGVKFYARREIKDVLAYLRVLLNPRDTVSLLRIINVPARKIGATTLSKIQGFSAEHGLPLWDCLQRASEVEGLNEPTVNRITSFCELIERFQEKTKTEVVSELTDHLIHAIKMEEWLKDGTDEGDERWGNVLELLTVTRKYDNVEPFTSLTSFLEEVSLVSEVDNLEEGEDALTLMTLHLCKGLEFEAVQIGGCEEGIFPHSNALFDREQLEEERRIMYVGMTRAKTHLKLLFAQTRQLWGQSQTNAPSRFLDDLPDTVTERRSHDVLSAFAWASQKGAEAAMTGDDAVSDDQEIEMEFNQDIAFESDTESFVEGTRIIHPSFGEGTVIERQGDIVEIVFDSGEKKRLALSIAPLRIQG